MGHEVFISHASEDGARARAACDAFERAGIRCWIAPRDVPHGKPYPAAILDAIRRSRVFVLILSSRANQSKDVEREVFHAFDKPIEILPLRIEDIKPTDSLHYYLGPIQWLDALPPPFEDHLQLLVQAVSELLGTRAEAQKSPPSPMLGDGAGDGWEGPVDLTCTDPAATWSKANPWMIRERCEGWDLRIKVLDRDGEHIFRFVPFGRMGTVLGGMKISDEDKRRKLWHQIVAGSSNTRPLQLRALYKYTPREA